MVAVTPSLGSVDKYIGAAEAAIRKGLGTAPTTTAPANSAAATNTQAQALAITDTIALADRADSLIAVYGVDGRFKTTVQGLKDNTSAKVLGAIGAGQASYTQAAPTTTLQTRTLETARRAIPKLPLPPARWSRPLPRITMVSAFSAASPKP
jgi:hypothetical protein